MPAGRGRLDLSWLSARDPSWLHFGWRGQLAFTVLGCVLISVWQLEVIEHPSDLSIGTVPQLGYPMWQSPHLEERPWTRAAGIRGIYEEKLKPFFYFFYYTGIFPITIPEHRRPHIETPTGPLPFLAEDEAIARELVKSPHVVMEDYAVIRKGDLGQIFLFYPDVWRRGQPANASARAFNHSIGMLSLLAVFVSLSLLQHRLLAVFLVAALGSNPYQVYQLYMQVNVWGYPIAIGSLMLAIHAPLILGKRFRPAFYLIPVLAGVVLASAREVRTEPALFVLSSTGACLFVTGDWRRRLALLGALVLSFSATSSLWSSYWDRSFAEARRAIAHTSSAPIGLLNIHHSLWHPVWCGLGDYARDHGYEFSDIAAYEYAIPEVNRRLGTRYETTARHRYLLRNLDVPGYNKIKPETIPEYKVVLRDKVLGDILGDPAWYLGVLGQRTSRILRLTTPIRLAAGGHYFDVPFSGWLFLPGLALVLATRRWDQAKLLAFYLPCSLPALLIYSLGGFTNPSAFHIVTFGLMGCWSVQLATLLYARARGRVADS